MNLTGILDACKAPAFQAALAGGVAFAANASKKVALTNQATGLIALTAFVAKVASTQIPQLLGRVGWLCVETENDGKALTKFGQLITTALTAGVAAAILIGGASLVPAAAFGSYAAMGAVAAGIALEIKALELAAGYAHENVRPFFA